MAKTHIHNVSYVLRKLTNEGVKMAANWSKKEMEYLKDSWGNATIPNMAKKLNRSVNAVKVKAFKLGLKRHIHSGKLITFSQLLRSLKLYTGYKERKTTWQKKGLKITYKKSIKKEYAMVSIKDFWKWAEQNRKYINFANVEENILGPEPAWVKLQRKADQ